MKSLINLINVLILSLLILSACVKSDGAIEKQVDLQNTTENIPIWFLTEDEWDNIIVAVGTAISSDLQMSYDKALLIAKKNLAK